MKTIKFLFIVIISILLISCNPCKRLTRKCPPVIKDSISYVETIKFDTIVLVSPADTLIIRIPVEPDLNDLIVDASNKPGPIVSVKIEDGFMEIIAICPSDSLEAIITSLQTELSNQTTITVEKEVPVRYTGKFAIVCIIGFICCIVLLIVWLYFKVKSGALKTALNRFR